MKKTPYPKSAEELAIQVLNKIDPHRKERQPSPATAGQQRISPVFEKSKEIIGSEQPAPATGEWTEAKVFAYFESEDFKGLSDAHNAALKAEREKRMDAEYQMKHWLHTEHQLREQLAAKQQELEEANRKGEDLSVSGMAAVGAMMTENDKLKHDLAAAQLLISKIPEYHGYGVTDTSCLDAYVKQAVESAFKSWEEGGELAFQAKVKEAVEPLVEALEYFAKDSTYARGVLAKHREGKV